MKKLSLIILVIMTACNNSTKVVFLGDSITQQGENFEGEGTYKGFITSLRENVSQEVELINKGIGGNKVPDLLLRYNDDVLKLKPNIVFIYIGINDVWHKYDWGSGTDIDIYEKGLRKIITDIKAVGAKIILCTPTVIGENNGEFKLNNNFKDIDTMEIMNKDLDAFSDVVRNLSSEFNTDLLDLRKKFKEYISENNDQNMPKGVLTSDGVHLNNEGNKLIADAMIKFLN
jgi:lysophospholipase L1-like esterase